MNKNEMIEKIMKNWRGFPNVNTVGKYDFLSQTVCANSLETTHLSHLINNPKDIQIKRKVLGIFIHEITHWLDHTSTLWGQNFLIDIFNAFNAKYNENIDDLWRIQKLFSDISRIYFADYYTANGSAANKTWNQKPWRYQFGSGLQFDKDGKISEQYPFLFTKFSTSDDELIKRVPLSVVSLLETNAIASENKLEISLLSSLSEEEILIENNLIQQSSLKNLYNPELTVYSVAAHSLANIVGISEITSAYFLSSALSTLCLNLPSQVFPLLKIPYDIQEAIGDRTKQMLKIQDRGFVFYLLANFAPKDNLSDVLTNSNILNWLESAVNAAGLPPLRQLEELALIEMNELDKEILKDPLMENFKELGAAIDEDNFICEYSRLKTLLKAGRENFTKRGICGNHELSLKSLLSEDDSCLKLPPILLGDDEVIQLGIEALGQQYQNLEEWIYYVWDMEDHLREFNKACFV